MVAIARDEIGWDTPPCALDGPAQQPPAGFSGVTLIYNMLPRRRT